MYCLPKLLMFCFLTTPLLFADNFAPPPNHAFGTVTPTEKTPGNMDCKGDCHNLISGGYMKFDLSKYAQGTQITQAKLTIQVLSLKLQSGYDLIYTWVCNIPIDPVTASPNELHAIIQKHEDRTSSYQMLRDTGYNECPLKQRGIDVINEALSKGEEERWIAMSYTFE